MLYEVTLSQTNSDFPDRIRTTNGVDRFYVEVLKKNQEDRFFQQQKEYKVEEIGLLYVLEEGELSSSILTKFHREPYSRHPGYQKMISIVKRHFFYPKLKADIAMFIAKC